MAKEIERKFLVAGEFKYLATTVLEITQGYLSTDPARIIRLRILNNKAVLSIKTPFEDSTISRSEWEFEIPVSKALEIMDVCVPGQIIKTRYQVPFGDHTYEVDVFHGSNEGLIIAEIELSHEDEEFIKPDWLGEEVTGRPEFYNVNLI